MNGSRQIRSSLLSRHSLIVLFDQANFLTKPTEPVPVLLLIPSPVSPGGLGPRGPDGRGPPGFWPDEHHHLSLPEAQPGLPGDGGLQASRAAIGRGPRIHPPGNPPGFLPASMGRVKPLDGSTPGGKPPGPVFVVGGGSLPLPNRPSRMATDWLFAKDRFRE